MRNRSRDRGDQGRGLEEEKIPQQGFMLTMRRKVILSGCIYFSCMVLLAVISSSAHSQWAVSGTESEVEPYMTFGMGRLTGAAASPAGGCFMTSSWQGLQLWSMEGRLLSTPISGTSVHATWSRDGSKIAAALGNRSYWILSKDGDVLVKSDPEKVLPEGFVRWAGHDAVVVHPGGFVTDSGKSNFTIWSLSNGTLLKEVEVPNNLLDISWSHDSSLAAICVAGDVYIYETKDWSLTGKIHVEAQLARVQRVTWSTDDRYLAFYSWRYKPGGNSIYLWDVTQGRVTAERDVSVAVESLSWSADGSFLAASFVNFVKIYSGSSLEPILSLKHPRQLTSVSWLPEGTRLLTGSIDGSVRIWDIRGRAASYLWKGEKSQVTHARYGASGSLAFGLSNGTLRCLSDPDTGRVAFSVDMVGSGAVSALEWSPDSSEIVVGYESGLVTVWSDTGSLKKSWEGHLGVVRDMGWSPGGDAIATVGDDGYLVVWDRKGGVTAKKMVNDSISLSWHPDGSAIATGHRSGTMNIWAYPYLELLQSPLRWGPFTSLEWAPTAAQPEADLLAGAGQLDGSCLVWDAWGRRNYYEKLVLHTGMITDISWSADGSMLATCSLDGDVRLWDMLKREISFLPQIDRWSLGHSSELSSTGNLIDTLRTGLELTSVDWAPDSGSIVVSSKSGTLLRWRLDDRVAFSMANHSSHITALSWDHDSSRIAFTVRPREIGIFNLDSNTTNSFEIEDMPEGAGILSIDWSPDGTRIAIGGSDNTVRVVYPDGDMLFSVFHDDDVNWVEWSPDSRYLASTSDDRTVKIWDGHTGSLMITFHGHRSRAYALSWSSDSRLLASCSEDGEVKIWNLSTGQCASSFKLSDRPAFFVAWNPNTSSLAVSVYDYSERGATTFLVDAEGSIIWRKALKGSSTHLAWSPDGSQLASGQSLSPEENGIAILSKSGVPLCNLNGHLIMERAEWSPDGRYIITGGFDGVLKLYDAGPISELSEPRIPISLIAIIITLLSFGGIMLNRSRSRRNERHEVSENG